MFSAEGMAAALKKGTPVDCRFGESDVYHRGVIRNRYRMQCDQYVVDFEDGETLVMLLAESGEHVVWRRVVGEGVRDETSEDARPTEQEIVQERVTEEVVVRYDLFKTLHRSGRQMACGQEIIYLKGECERLPNGDYQMTYGPTKYFPRHTQDRLTVRQYEECKRRVRDDEHDSLCVFVFADTICDDVDETERRGWQAIRRCSGTSIASVRSEPAACSGQRFNIQHGYFTVQPSFLIAATIGMFDYGY